MRKVHGIEELNGQSESSNVQSAYEKSIALQMTSRDRLKWLTVVESGNVQAVRYFLKIGIDNTTTTESGKTAIHLVAQRGDVAMLRLLLESGFDLNVKDIQNNSALHDAAVHGNTGAATFLIAEKGFDPNVENSDGQTPLSLAAENGHEAVVKLLQLGSE